MKSDGSRVISQPWIEKLKAKMAELEATQKRKMKATTVETKKENSKA
jgi:hypothetical protein